MERPESGVDPFAGYDKTSHYQLRVRDGVEKFDLAGVNSMNKQMKRRVATSDKLYEILAMLFGLIKGHHRAHG